MKVKEVKKETTRSAEVQYMIDSFKESIGPQKLKDMQRMFANGYSQLVRKESQKKKSNPILL